MVNILGNNYLITILASCFDCSNQFGVRVQLIYLCVWFQSSFPSEFKSLRCLETQTVSIDTWWLGMWGSMAQYHTVCYLIQLFSFYLLPKYINLFHKDASPGSVTTHTYRTYFFMAHLTSALPIFFQILSLFGCVVITSFVIYSFMK